MRVARPTVRLFAALRPPADIVAAIAEMLERGRREVPEARWVRTEQVHLTLAFWPAVPERALPALTRALRAAAAEFAPFELTLAGVGAFPDAHRPRTVWIGAEPGAREFTWLARSAQAAARSVGVVVGRQGATAHLTLARPQSADAAVGAIRLAESIKRLPRGQRTWVATSFELVESVLDHRGAEHRTVGTFALVG